MDFLTHLCISNKLKKIVEKQFDIKLDTLSFMIGNVKPDLSSKYMNIPHYKKDSFTFIQNEIQDILTTKIYEKHKCTSYFSERLGILTHYLSDFFCSAHSDNFKGSMLEHYSYEMQVFVNYLTNYKVINTFCSKDFTIKHNVSSLISYIDSLHKKYSYECRDLSPVDDLLFTFKACMTLCFSIVSICLINQESLQPSALLFHRSL